MVWNMKMPIPVSNTSFIAGFWGGQAPGKGRSQPEGMPAAILTSHLAACGRPGCSETDFVEVRGADGSRGSVRSGFDETKLRGLQMIAQSNWRIQSCSYCQMIIMLWKRFGWKNLGIQCWSNDESSPDLSDIPSQQLCLFADDWKRHLGRPKSKTSTALEGLSLLTTW